MRQNKPLNRQQLTVMLKSFFVNTVLIALKISAGFAFKSQALIADGIHSFSDFLSDIMVIIGIKQSAKPADKEHPFGHGKLEYVVSIFLGISILLVAYQMIRFFVLNINDTLEAPSLLGLFVALIVIVVKAVLSRYLLLSGKILESHMIIASGKESMTDVISSIAVLIGIGLTVIGHQFNITWLYLSDRIAALFIAFLIAKIAIEILIDSAKMILGKSAPQTVLDSTKKRIESVPGVLHVDRLDMIVYGHYYQVMVEILVDGNLSVESGHNIATVTQGVLQENEKIAHVLVHVNPNKP